MFVVYKLSNVDLLSDSQRDVADLNLYREKFWFLFFFQKYYEALNFCLERITIKIMYISQAIHSSWMLFFLNQLVYAVGEFGNGVVRLPTN